MPPEMEDMADAAGDAALEAYQTALDGGADPSEAAGAAIEAASTVMTEMGAPADMVDTMASAAQDGFDSALADGANPGDAFEAAGDSVDTAFGGEGDMGSDGPMASRSSNRSCIYCDDRNGRTGRHGRHNGISSSRRI